MARLIPNERTKVHFVPEISDMDAPTANEITDGVDLTDFLVTLEASSTGQTVPTPSFESLFETSIPGTVTAQFTAEFYRDDETDTAWDTLPRATDGYMVIARFGYSGEENVPEAGDDVEVWPIRVTTRAAMALTNNESQRFNLEAAVPRVPSEDASVAS